MMHCTTCGVYFDAPLVREGSDPTVAPGYRYREELCPICGQPHIEEAAVCPECGDYMPAGHILCRGCRADLSCRFTDFLDRLTADEEKQLDEWLDGRSVTEREKFL